MAKYSIIIPTYSNLELLKRCVESAIECSISPEIIVVDNGSTDGTDAYLGYLKKNYAHFLRVIQLEENKGFAVAINCGIREARTDNIILLNDDAFVTPRWNLYLSECLEEANRNGHSIGIISPLTNCWHSPPFCVIPQSDANNAATDPWGYAAHRHRQFGKSIRRVMWMPFSCVMIKREVFNNVGYLDEQFFPGGFEDNDFCARALQQGYTAALAEGIFVQHVGAQTFKKYFPEMNIGLKNLTPYLNKWLLERNNKKDVRIGLGAYFLNPGKQDISKISKYAEDLGLMPVFSIDNSNTAGNKTEREQLGINDIIARARTENLEWLFFCDLKDQIDPFLDQAAIQHVCRPINPLITVFSFPVTKGFGSFIDRKSGVFSNRLYQLLPHRKNLCSFLLEGGEISIPVPYRITEHLELEKGKEYDLCPITNDSQMSLCMIVKDEEALIDQFLFKHYYLFHEIYILDTGSSDSTIELLSRWPINLRTGYEWTDFSSARNTACELANTPWIMQLDWDEELRIDEKFYFQMHKEAVAGYFVKILSQMPYGKPSQTENVRIFRNKPGLKYTGKVHETVVENIIAHGAAVEMSPFNIDHYGYLKPAAIIQNKLDHYEKQLWEELTEDPFRSRAYYDLALHFFNEDQSERGREYLRKAITLQPNLLLTRKELAFDYIDAAFKEFEYIHNAGGADGFLQEIAKRVLTTLNPIHEERPKVGIGNG